MIGINQPGELKRLQILLNSTARVATGIKLKDHVTNEAVLDKDGVISIQHMTTEAIISTVCKTLRFQDKGLEHFWNIRETNSNLSTRSQTRGDLQLPSAPMSRRLLNSLQVKGAITWNACPESIRSLDRDYPPKKEIKLYVKTL